MEYSFPEKIFGILFRPIRTFRNLRNESPADAIFLFGSGLLFFIGLITVSTFTGLNQFLCWPWSAISTLLPTPGAIPVYLFGGFILMLGVGICAHFWLFIAGGRGIFNTFRVVMYVSVPLFFLSWIPYLGFLTVPWTIIIYVIALRELHSISYGKSAFATFGILLIPMIRVGFLVLMLLTNPTSVSGLTDNAMFFPPSEISPVILTRTDLPASFTSFDIQEISPENYPEREKKFGCLNSYKLSLSQGFSVVSDPTSIE
ncbi:MAG: Yip1 family protein, partial [Methanoregula sp.]|nr:Yip1 family protein [Methanoregula sp.]